MSYVFKTTVSTDFESAIEKVTSALQERGFGVLTEIDVKATFKKKLDADFRKYRILGACHPQHAYRALQSEAWIGAMLPCNVVVQENEQGQIEIGAIDPVASMQAIDNPELGKVAQEVRDLLQEVIHSLR